MPATIPVFAQTETTPKLREGPLSDYIISVLAKNSGLGIEELQARMANGETIGQIAQSLSQDKVFVADLVKTAVTNALNDGAITQDQAKKIENRKINRVGGAMLEKLELTREELQAKLDSGMTMGDILAEAGLPAPRPDNPAMLRRLGLTREELQAKLDSGMTMEQIRTEAGLPDKKPINDDMLEKLGLTQEEIQAKLDSGMTMEQIRTEAGVPNKPGNENPQHPITTNAAKPSSPPKPGNENHPPPPHRTGPGNGNPPPAP